MTDAEFLSGIDRRTFLRIISITGAAGLVYPRNLLSGISPLDLSRVIIIDDSSATSGLTIVAEVVQSMVNCGIVSLAEQSSVGEAWKALLPGVSEASVVGIKVACLNTTVPTHPEVSYAVANSLQEMDFDGTPFPENNIIIFDRSNNELAWSGYTLNEGAVGIRCYGTDSGHGGYTTETYVVYNSPQRLSLIATQQVDYIVNISALKNHTIAGVTLCLKNHYGTCNRPEYMHGGRCNPYIPALNALAHIRDKNRVNICDGLFGIATGGPLGSPQFAANTLIMSRDIVAVDYLGREILADNGCDTIGISGHVDTAAGSPYYLGTNDPAQMDVVTISDPAGAGNGFGFTSVILQQNRPNPFKSETRIRFFMPRPGPVTLSVYDSLGRRVRRLVDNAVGTGWHDVAWDGRTDKGSLASGGVYFCRLEADSYKKAIIMQLVR
jgi:uncharacterized protein (DUF362 family)